MIVVSRSREAANWQIRRRDENISVEFCVNSCEDGLAFNAPVEVFRISIRRSDVAVDRFGGNDYFCNKICGNHYLQTVTSYFIIIMFVYTLGEYLCIQVKVSAEILYVNEM